SGLLSAFFVDRYDRKRVLLVIHLGFTIGTLACALAQSYVSFLLARCVAGGFGGILTAIVFSIIADAIPYERRSAAMGIVMTAFSVASVVGVPAGIFLAAEYSWRMPFFVVGGVSVIVLFMIQGVVPSLRKHLENGAPIKNPFQILGNIARDPNQVRALSFSIILILGHFTIIPFIAPYMQLNIGFSDYEVTYIYLAGGTASAICLPLFGRLADRFGNIRVFTIMCTIALGSIWAITHLDTNSIVIALLTTTSYFIVSSGRTVPATTMVTSAVSPESRGSFMSMRTAVNQAGLAIGSFIAGLIVTEQADGSLQNYALVGYFTIGMSILAIVLAQRLRVAG
ncbi:MAG: MFS transporter, partial [Bacteroidota bacterium]